MCAVKRLRPSERDAFLVHALVGLVGAELGVALGSRHRPHGGASEPLGHRRDPQVEAVAVGQLDQLDQLGRACLR